jgi:hypothetical protein
MLNTSSRRFDMHPILLTLAFKGAVAVARRAMEARPDTAGGPPSPSAPVSSDSGPARDSIQRNSK